MMRGSSGAVGAVDTVEAEVRELVRRRGLDPVIDRAAMRRWVEEVVTGHDAQALTSASPAISQTAYGDSCGVRLGGWFWAGATPSR